MMEEQDISNFINDIPEDVLKQISFSMPWQYNATETYDEDGFSETEQIQENYTRKKLQDECWKKFHQNPQLNTAIRGIVGRLVGLGFGSYSEIPEIQEQIDETEKDPRNRLYNFWPKYIARLYVEGELHLSFTCHLDGFIEIDFIDSADIDTGGDDDTGIIFHPTKTHMPIFYNVKDKTGTVAAQIPSIFVARYPEVVDLVAKHPGFQENLQEKSKNYANKFKKFKNFNRFIVSFDKGFLTRRAVSYLRTTIEWINYYENLKRYEIDHKKSSGAYLWTFSITDPKMYKMWLSMSDVDKKKTGIMSKKVPGGTLILPPGIELNCVNPNLTSIKDQDTDILQMVASGLNEPNDVMTGTPSGTFASVKASRGPMSDRIADEIAYFERYLKYDFWGSIFFLKSEISNFPKTFKIREAVKFDKEKNPVMKLVPRKPEELIEISFPVSNAIEMADKASALLGVKHGPIAETLGIPNAEVAKHFGFNTYAKMRLKQAEEKEIYPELIYNIDAESLQEQVEAEPKRNKGTQPKEKSNGNGNSKSENSSKAE
jgi:hypothetical protein